MTRYGFLIYGAVLAASFAGCGNSSSGTNNGTADMAMSTAKPDLEAAQDLAMAAGPCTGNNPGCTGDPCTKTTDCAKGTGPNQAAKCITTITNSQTMQTVTYTGGFCTSACRPSKNDPGTGINPDCPGGNGICAGTGTTGTCVYACGSIGDCRDQYVCAFTNGTTSGDCEPIGASQCDPAKDPRPQMAKCMAKQDCVSYSPDESYGQCADQCDPVAQGCGSDSNGNALGCIVNFSSANGSGDCINVNDPTKGSPMGDGVMCTFLNGCDPGFMCYGGVCRQYCRVAGDGGANIPDGGVPATCPAKQTCQNIKEQGATIMFTNAETGICSP